ncbi:predicted protein [Nematostella vectensis]|uniref:F-box/LRR-repeat protein 5 n=1 Tax=Nematostella vectensis TaxID=45351 RepID=A7RQP2_NEMVE|nr:predicted protein [Nematostella vectensis]|eukprot:XP_001638260.1 predicted protein [Nematostella vectensis]
MAPLVCPEEVDVFRIPHLRMKQIISDASEKISTANFRDSGSLGRLLSSFYDIFQELKHHEEVENSCIMRTLQRRLTDDQIRAIVKDVHKHSHVQEILALIRKGFKKTNKSKTLLTMINYETKLKRAIDEFERDIIPHMKHEEEVFQPLLMEHFTFAELKSIREEVVGLHKAFFEVYFVLLWAMQTDCFKHYIDNVVAQSNGKLKAKSTQVTLIHNLPPEILNKIFSYLNPKDLCRTSQVCKSWSVFAKDGQLWKHLYPVRWICKNDWCFGEVEDTDCNCNKKVISRFLDSYADADADMDESGESDDDCSQGSSAQIQRLLGITNYLLPLVGKHVQTLKLACCPYLSNGLVFKMLSHCPNVERLDLSQTAVSDYGLKGLFRRGGGSQLKTFDVSGCSNLTDKALVSLSSALGEATSNADIEEGRCDCTAACKCSKVDEQNLQGKRTLRYLSLSGCYQLTDAGLRSLASNGGLPTLEFLDLSGCLNVTAQGLCDLVSVCPSLDHAQFFYCDNIDAGPYPDTASGCQNLECTNRVCCRLGE